MANRITKVTTKTGDQGQTRLGNGEKVSKSNMIMEVIGTVDELQSALGLLIASLSQDNLFKHFLLGIQQDLFNISGELAMPGFEGLQNDKITELETALDALNKDLPALKDFVVPGADLKSAHAHLARTICRRAERRLVFVIDEGHHLRSCLLVYLNRLSDYLFVLARHLHHQTGLPEQIWHKNQ